MSVAHDPSNVLRTWSESFDAWQLSFGELRTKLENKLDMWFEITDRGSTIYNELFCGYINFISCLYVLPVIPNQLAAAGYSKSSSVEATALACGVGCILSSYITNLPFVIAPPTAVSIYLAVALQQNGMDQSEGDTAVMLSGCALLLIGIVKPLSTFVTKLIPECIQASTAVGIGLITALAGLIELELVVTGKYTILELGILSPAIMIALVGVIIIATAMHFHVKGAFMLALTFGTFTWWWYDNAWPDALFDYPRFEVNQHLVFGSAVIFLLFNLIFLYILTLNGIARSMSDLANLTNFDHSIPRGNWLYIVCGLSTILSGCFSGPPILISPESAAGIKAGAKTGLSTLVCGTLFLCSIFFCPVLSHVPPAGTSPLLIIVGMMLFVNTSRIKWSEPVEATPAFFVLLLIPFTYSILSGVGFGYILYITMCLCTGQFYTKAVSVYTSLYHSTCDRENYDCILSTSSSDNNDLTSSPTALQLQQLGQQKKGEHDGTVSSGSDKQLLSASEQQTVLHNDDKISETTQLSPSRRPPLVHQRSATTLTGSSSASQRLSGGEHQRQHHSRERRQTIGGGGGSGGGTRVRNNSLFDQLPMDLETGIQSMQAEGFTG